jgi:hypothetical protein
MLPGGPFDVLADAVYNSIHFLAGAARRFHARIDSTTIIFLPFLVKVWSLEV